MRVLITRPEREATALAAALGARGHTPIVAPLFQLAILHPPEPFAAALAASQAVLLTSANGARALADCTDQRSKPIFAVGDTTAATAEGLGFTNVASASGDSAALAELVRQRLDPKDGPLLHASGLDVIGEIELAGFEVRRFALYEAREAPELPDSARAALQARAVDAATIFSPRASSVFVRLVASAGLAQSCRPVTAIAISGAAAQPLGALPFKAVRTAARPTRQSVLDEIDRPAEVGVQGRTTMSDTPSPPVDSLPPPASPVIMPVKRGLGVLGAFVIGLVSAVIVVAAALFSLPYWPQEAREMWRGPPPQLPAPAPVAPPPAAPTVDIAGPVNNAVDAAKRELNGRLDDLEKRVRAAATTAAQADHPAVNEGALADLRAKIDALEKRPAGDPDMDKEVASLKKEVDALRDSNQQVAASEQKTIAAARASAIVGIAARLSAAVEQGLPFAGDLALLPPLVQASGKADDAKLTEAIATLQPMAAAGVAGRATLVSQFPAMAKAALAEDVADDSFGQRVLGKIKSIVSLRRVGDDVQGDTAEARLARAEAALNAGDIAKAVELVKSLPPQSARATAPWLAKAEAHLAAQRAVDQLSAEAVSLLGAARP